MSENAEFDEILEILAETAEFKEEYSRQVMRGLLYGFQGYGKNMRAKEEMMRRVYPVSHALDSQWMPVGVLKTDPPTELPQKVCDYRKSSVEWYGSRPLDAIMNITGRRDGQMSMHWAVTGDTVEEYNPLKGRRFIGVSEPEEQLTAKYMAIREAWVPQGQLFIGGSKPLKINEKSKETIEQVKRIEYP